jgi:replicative DNA helicase
MAQNKYVDTTAIVNVLGCLYNNPSLFDDDSVNLTLDDFTEEFHKIIFGTFYNLHQLGAEEFTISTVEDYLAQRPKKLAVFKNNKGDEYLIQIKENTDIATFSYYYHRVKKFTLLRAYNEKLGMDMSWLYDINNIFDLKKKQKQEDWLDNATEEQIDEKINDKITNVRLKYSTTAENNNIIQAEDGGDILWERLHSVPDIGYPLYGDIINSVFRGERLKKFYLRSAPTNVGKSRAMVADCCNTACNEIYDLEQNKWVSNGTTQEPSIYIMTEQEFDEVQTMMWAFVSGVNEDHILMNTYEGDEEERVLHAREILAKSPLYLKELHDFALKDIENVIKIAVHKQKVRYVFLDYIHTSMKILSEVGGRSNIKGLREDNVLFMIGVRLKDLANEYGVFIESSTQLNGDYRDAKVFDQNLLRGAKSLGDKIDAGSIMLLPNEEDREVLKGICEKNNLVLPNLKISVYKNRRGRYNHIFVWCNADLGTCRIKPIFVTDWNYEIINVPVFKTKVIEVKESAF